MTETQIWHHNIGSGEQNLVYVIDRDIMKSYSKTARDSMMYDQRSGVYKLIISTATVRSLRFIIGEIVAVCTEKSTPVLDVKVTTSDLKEALDILQAGIVLQLEPAQPQIEAHITRYVSSKLVTPREMQNVVDMHGDPDVATHKIFKTMVHTVAYKYVHGHVSNEQLAAIDRAWKAGGRFAEALDLKIAELEEKKNRKASKEQADGLEAADESAS